MIGAFRNFGCWPEAATAASVRELSPLFPECDLFGVIAVHHQYGHRHPS
ncbi:hypothetical protein SAMN05444164_7732 [Bradyrhizobium erythrophlei]|uniref:Uncharacterized protein n=1 Tax=Bradyrhizobium erythrophlei TaxID=1437360 RepID=A0A1H5I191_9BRAD|nr:hypothetical protein SAMN05444164_7732 [Bradyrhizobium erythrophlei]